MLFRTPDLVSQIWRRAWAGISPHLGPRLARPGGRVALAHRDAFGDSRIEEQQPRLPIQKSEIEGTEILPLSPGIGSLWSEVERLQCEDIVVSERAQHGEVFVVDPIEAGAGAMHP